MSSSTSSQKVVPAQLDFLAIYNPSLGTTDETIDQQIVYFSSAKSRRSRQRSTGGKTATEVSHDEQNERLRQIGLAQGMIEFAKTFSDGKAVDTIETDKSRIILHELEAGWWILASVSLTQLPSAPQDSRTKIENDKPSAEYSSREVKPATLLLQDLLRAHATFLLHHAASMSALFVRTRRSKFSSILGRYWDSYLSVWNVMLHGNPAVSIYGGIKLAASGELGVGVGEEDRGSGEREVLEGFVPRIEGLVDIVVSRFGDADPNEVMGKHTAQTPKQVDIKPTEPWLGTGAEPGAEDGAIFLGTGALSRKSLRDVTHWMEDLYSWGPNAYGVLVNPTSNRSSRHSKKQRQISRSVGPPVDGLKDSSDTPNARDLVTKDDHQQGKKSVTATPGDISDASLDADPGSARSKVKHSLRRHASSSQSSVKTVKSSNTAVQKPNKLVSLLKMGYGTHWSLGVPSYVSETNTTEQPEGIPPRITDLVPQEPALRKQDDGIAKEIIPPFDDSKGHYLVGLMGDLDSDEDTGDGKLDSDTASDSGVAKRTLLRTLTVELEREGDARAEADISIDFGNRDNASSSQHGSSQHTNASATSYESQDRNKTKKLQIVVYAKRPFLYAFLFELRTPSLAYSSLYKSLHHQLGPLQRPLLTSTQETLSRPELSSTTTEAEAKTAPIYDLIWDPRALTITSTVPNIPNPILRSENDRGWSRMEALSTHMQLLNTFTSTRTDTMELERTAKTNRGWWVVWARIHDSDIRPSSAVESHVSDAKYPPAFKTETSVDSNRTVTTSAAASTVQNSMYSGPAHPFDDTAKAPEWVPMDKEIILIRKASDHTARSISNGAGYLGEGMGWGSSAPAKLAQGIGVDTKRYIEGLLNMGN